MSRFDEIRAANPELGLAAYAIEPGGDVTLEIITPDEEVFRFVGPSLDVAIEKAFPPEPPAPAIDIFA